MRSCRHLKLLVAAAGAGNLSYVVGLNVVYSDVNQTMLNLQNPTKDSGPCW